MFPSGISGLNLSTVQICKGEVGLAYQNFTPDNLVEPIGSGMRDVPFRRGARRCHARKDMDMPRPQVSRKGRKIQYPRALQSSAARTGPRASTRSRNTGSSCASKGGGLNVSFRKSHMFAAAHWPSKNDQVPREAEEFIQIMGSTRPILGMVSNRVVPADKSRSMHAAYAIIKHISRHQANKLTPEHSCSLSGSFSSPAILDDVH